MATKKKTRATRPSKWGENRRRVESMVGELAHHNAILVERNDPQGKRAVERFDQFSPILRNALDRGGEDAALAVIAFRECMVGYIRVCEAKNTLRAARTHTKMTAAPDRALLAKFKNARAGEPTDDSARKSMARSELRRLGNADPSEADVEKEAERIRTALRRAKNRIGTGGIRLGGHN